MQPKQQSHRNNWLRFLLSLLVLIVTFILFLYRDTVIDYMTTFRYPPSAKIVKLADESRMSDRGRFLFYASRPSIDQRSNFNTNCGDLVEKSTVLGCYSARRIYIFDVTDERLQGVKEVTAAHEMLHAVYDRLSAQQQSKLDRLLEDQLKKVSDPKIKELIALYDRVEPGARLNEIHSIFGTQVNDLSPELEAHYKTYLTDRKHVVGLSERYEGVFRDIEKKQTAIVNELNQLADTTSAEIEAYNSAATQLAGQINAFNDKARGGGYSSQQAFTTDRTVLIAKQDALNLEREKIEANLATYQQKKTELDTLNGQAESLNASISSRLEKAPSF